MKKILYIDCCIRREQSRTRQLAERFLEGIRSRHAYALELITLMDEGFQYFSDGFFFQREALLKSGALNHPRFRYAHQFQSADRIVIAAPFWDLSFPALLKVYIENISVDGITFACDETGCHGVCKASKLLFLTTRGGCYEGSRQEMGARYLAELCGFFGIPDFELISADGLDLGIEPADVILNRAISQAEACALTF